MSHELDTVGQPLLRLRQAAGSGAWKHFGQIANPLQRVQTICDWVQNNIEYRCLSGRADLSASEVITRGHVVCRDFAHAAIALSRALAG